MVVPRSRLCFYAVLGVDARYGHGRGRETAEFTGTLACEGRRHRGLPPNVKLATERLSSLGVQVVNVSVSDIEPMPFADGEFSLILNRHAPFNSSEVARILSMGETFLTQQVHGMWAWDLVATFDAAPSFPDATPRKYVPTLEAAGLAIQTVEEWEGCLFFTDVGAIVSNLKAIPWVVPEFTVGTHLRYLRSLQERLEAGEELGFHAAKYLIEARKP